MRRGLAEHEPSQFYRRICDLSTFVVTNPMPESNRSAVVTMSKFLRVLKGSRRSITLVGGNVSIEKDIDEIQIYSVDLHRSRNKILRILSMIWVQIKIALFLLKNIQEGDEVFFWLADKMLLPFVAAKAKAATRYYFVYGDLSKTNGDKLLTRASCSIVQYMANHAEFVCAESKSVIDSWESKLNNDVKIIHLYAENIIFSPLECRRNRVGMLTRIAPEKHIHECIRAFVHFHKSYPDWNLEILGSGKDEESCRNLIKELDAEDYISMVGWVDHVEVKAYAQKWKWFMSASDHEGVPNGLIEMMGYGIPAIAHPVGGIPDVLMDHVAGYYLGGTTAMDIEEGLYKAVQTKNYDQLAKAAHETILEHFSLECAQADLRIALAKR